MRSSKSHVAVSCPIRPSDRQHEHAEEIWAVGYSSRRLVGLGRHEIFAVAANTRDARLPGNYDRHYLDSALLSDFADHPNLI